MSVYQGGGSGQQGNDGRGRPQGQGQQGQSQRRSRSPEQTGGRAAPVPIRNPAGSLSRIGQPAPGQPINPRLLPRGKPMDMGKPDPRPEPMPRARLEKIPFNVEVPATSKELEYSVLFEPKCGISGSKEIMVSTNHHLIKCLPRFAIWAHDIKIKVAPDSQHNGESATSTQQNIRILLKKEVLEFFGDDHVFDGVSQVWSPRQLVPLETSQTLQVAMEKRRDGRPNNIFLTVTAKGRLPMAPLGVYVQNGVLELDSYHPRAGIENQLKWIAATFRKDPASRLATKPNGNAYFDRDIMTTQILHSTKGTLEARRGTYQTVQIRFMRLTMNIDTVTTPFWVPDKPLLEVVSGLLDATYASKVYSKFLEKGMTAFRYLTSKMLGICFHVKHLGPRGNSKKLKMRAFTMLNAIQTRFDERLEDGSTVKTNVNDYFLRKYKIKLEYPLLPLISTSRGEFPVEVCWSCKDERYKEVLQGPDAADFIKFATCSADKRKEQIDRCMQLMAHHKNTTLQRHGIVLEPKMHKVKAHILPHPRLTYGGRKNMSPVDGSWNLRGLQFHTPQSIESWVTIHLHNGAYRPMEEAAYKELMGNMKKAFKGTGMRVPTQDPPMLAANPNGKIEDYIKQARETSKKTFNAQPNVIFFLLQVADTKLYQVIKQGMDMHVGIASQVMTQGKCGQVKGQIQYCANIAMKVNVKLGGVNCVAFDPFWSDHGRTMLMGGDICHSSPSALRNPNPPPSTAAIVGTWDQACTAYTAVACAQESTRAMIANIKPMFVALLERYRKKNNNLYPQRLIYYRDGVSESEFQEILVQEGRPLRDLFDELKHQCLITIICAIKRHHTRFFPETNPTRHGNVQCGTVVQNNIRMNDAFIIAHNDLQGTKRPTRYVSLVDQNKLSKDDFLRITLNLCSSYARATRSVAVCPPIYYADQVAERAKLHLSRDPKTDNLVLNPVHKNLTYTMYWQ